MRVAKIGLGLTGASLLCYLHPNMIKHYVLSQELPPKPHYNDDGPPFTLKRNEGFEKNFDLALLEVENNTPIVPKPQIDPASISGKSSHPIASLFPPGKGARFQDKDGRLYTGKFNQDGSEGYVKIQTPVEGKTRVEKSLFEKGVRQYYVIYHEDGTRCEGPWDRFCCVKPDGSFYLERMDEENKRVESFLYNNEGYLKLQSVSTGADKSNGTYYYDDGKVYTGDMDENGPHGEGVLRDKYGDISYEGTVDHGNFYMFHKRFIISMTSLMSILAAFTL